MKNKNISISLNKIIKTFQKYNLTIFIVVLVTGLSVAVLMLNAILIQSSNASGYIPPADITSFDQSTIDRVKQLHTSSDTASQFNLPSGRINPFSE